MLELYKVLERIKQRFREVLDVPVEFEIRTGPDRIYIDILLVEYRLRCVFSEVEIVQAKIDLVDWYIEKARLLLVKKELVVD